MAPPLPGPAEGDPPDPGPEPVRLTAQDRISEGDAVRRAVRRLLAWTACRVGRHVWAVRHNPEVGGPRAVYQQCRRCGRERTDWALRGTFED
jgi:hypothetical protein